VTSHIRNAVTVIHGPKGCAHHNFSLLHATGLDNEEVRVPDLISTGLSENDIVFGGEETLCRTLESVTGRGTSAVFVLSTCIVETIGDDIVSVCSKEYGVPVIPVPTAGFLGGTFQDGVNNALIALAGTAGPCTRNDSVNIIGEKNLEYEIEQNYTEIVRLLSMLGLPVNIRFVHNLPFCDLPCLGAAKLNILRDPSLLAVGKFLKDRFGIPYIDSFPVGLSGTLSFIKNVAETCNVDGSAAVSEEQALQEEMLASFADLTGAPAMFDYATGDSAGVRAAEEIVHALQLQSAKNGNRFLLNVNPGAGTSGMKRMLHRWRRAIHA
jgi:nitrogenase molybdenum-iron protein alpha/beta subunit